MEIAADPTKLLYPSEETRRDIANLLPVVGVVTALVWEGQNLSAYQMSMRYLNPWPSYFYFRFRKTNGRHIGILLPVPIWSYTHFAMQCFIIPQSLVDILPFTPKLLAFMQNPIWRRPQSWICSKVLLDYPRSRVGGPKKRWKFCVNRLTSFRDMCIIHFCRLCLKMLIPAHFGEVFWGWPPKCSQILSRPPKGTSLAGNTRFDV